MGILKALEKKLTWFVHALIGSYVEAMYHEYPIENEQGSVIGYEWFVAGSGGSRVFFVPRKEEEGPSIDEESDITSR